jgi:biotin carboxyl carrier protein
MFKITTNDQVHELQVADLEALDLVETSDSNYHILFEGQAYRAEIEEVNFAKKQLSIKINGNKYDLNIEDKYDLLVKKMGLSFSSSQKMKEVKAPMPGLVLDVLVGTDQAVNKGDALLILEAMKMENILKAEGEGVVKSIEVAKGATVDKGQIIIKMH